MSEVAEFQLKLVGGMSDAHAFEAYDGFTSLAGAAFTLSLVTNYLETGEIRYRGDFQGRRAVHASKMRQGSLIVDFSVILQSNPAAVFGAAAASLTASGLLYGLVSQVISRNTGYDSAEAEGKIHRFIERKRGDFEALVARTEPSIRQSHEVIGRSTEEINWIGGLNIIAKLDEDTKDYMKSTVHDREVFELDVTVSGFYGNSGHGSVFDKTIGRNVPIGMTKEKLETFGSFFSWGLHQYIEGNGKTIRIKFSRILTQNGRPKRYLIQWAGHSK